MAKSKTEYSKVRDALGCHADAVGRNRDGNYVARRGYFYSHGGTADSFAASMTRLLNAAGIKHTVVNTWDKWAAFRGGASVAQGTHWGMEFKVHSPSPDDSVAQSNPAA